ncbi:MAG: C4-type zinc ribbon domain-containing protein [Kofleriaceae bacterium]
MKEQLVRLLQLQQCDAKVKELEAEVARLPAKLDPMRRDLARLEAMLATEQAEHDRTLDLGRQQEGALEREHESLKQARMKLQATKNGKEYNAASREVEYKRKSVSDREADLRKIGEVLTEAQAKLEAHTKDVESLRGHVAEEEAAIGGQLDLAKAKLAEAVVARDAARGPVTASWLKTYDALSTKKGFAVASVVGGVCQGCHMALPPQLNNVLARMESIETCPRCSRLVYRQELLETALAELQAAEGGAPAAADATPAEPAPSGDA